MRQQMTFLEIRFLTFSARVRSLQLVLLDVIRELRLENERLITNLTRERSIADVLVKRVVRQTPLGVKALVTDRTSVDAQLVDSEMLLQRLFTLEATGALETAVRPLRGVRLDVLGQIVLASKPEMEKLIYFHTFHRS